ncbi:MAG: adenylate/guanylate cyclase domain-containing protein [Oscillatoriaceae cyanobacterium SKYGB_i_bin93]|nr:adenylate/guanylate cyclase domain-containing protein [Oscillatoriaceae cyanobacterium SKYGB_i_bin93]
MILNRDLIVLEASSGVQRFAEYPERPLKGKNVCDSFPELIGTEDILIAVLEGQQESFELKSIGRFSESGSPLYFDFYVNVCEIYESEDNCKNHLVVFIQDVTERMLLEQRLVQATNETSLLLSALCTSRNYTNRIISSMADALLVTNLDGYIKKVNRAALKLFEYEKEEELIGKSILDIIDKKFFLFLRQNYDVLAEGEILNNLEVVCKTKSGKKIFIEFSCSTIETETEDIRDFLYIGRDITERLRMQQRQAAQYATARVLSESATIQQALPKILIAICESLGWTVGEIWMPSESGDGFSGNSTYLRCVEIWSKPEITSEFVEIAKQFTRKPGEGLVGQVWITGQPQWMDDIASSTNVIRKEIALREGLKVAFAFPIPGEEKILGVMLFFARDEHPFDADLKKTMTTIGSQIGQFIKRKQAEEALRRQQEKTDHLLLNILPEPIVNRLKQEPSTIAEDFTDVTVLFADIVGFTQISSYLSPIQLVSLLNQIFSAFDRLTEQYGLEKIKTIGDAYMAVGGLPLPRKDHAEAIADMAIDMMAALEDFNKKNNQNFSIRIGIHSGPVVAGVIGLKKFIYDLWGDTVNTASRMESHSLAGRIHVSEATYQLLKERYLFEPRGVIHVKGKGEMTTYFLIGRKDKICSESQELQNLYYTTKCLIEKIEEHLKDI